MYGIRPYGTVPYGTVPDSADAPTLVRIPFSISASARFSIYASTAPFITGNGDLPANQAFDGGMTDPLRFNATARGDGAVVSGFSSGDGSLALDNMEGRFNILTGSYALDGRDHEVRMGRAGVPYRDWFPVFRGTARSFFVNARELTVQLADYGHKLDQPLQPNEYAGTGGAQGGDDLKGKRRPRALGYLSNITAPLVNSPKKIFQVSDGSCHAITANVNGLPLAFGGDHAGYAALDAASTSAGYYYTSLASGHVRINDLGDNQVATFDVEGENEGGFTATVPEIVRRMAATWLTDAEIYEPGFASYAAGAAYEAGYYADHNSTVTVREAIADMLGAGSFAYFTRLGKLSISRLTRPTGAPIVRLDDTTVLSAERLPLPESLSVPPWQWRVAYGRNWTPMTGNIAGAVTDARRAWLSESLRYATAEDAAIRRVHPLSQAREIGGYLRGEAAAQAEADRLLALHRRAAALYRIRLGLKGYRIEQGHTVHIASNRLRWLRSGRSLFVIERNIDAKNRAVEIVGYG